MQRAADYRRSCWQTAAGELQHAVIRGRTGPVCEATIFDVITNANLDLIGSTNSESWERLESCENLRQLDRAGASENYVAIIQWSPCSSTMAPVSQSSPALCAPPFNRRWVGHLPRSVVKVSKLRIVKINVIFHGPHLQN